MAATDKGFKGKELGLVKYGKDKKNAEEDLVLGVAVLSPLWLNMASIDLVLT